MQTKVWVMEQDAIDRFTDRLRREFPEVPAGAVAILGRIERLALLHQGAVRFYDRDYGVSAAEIDVLAALRLAGFPYKQTPTAIAANVVITSGGMTKRLDRMEADGCLERRPDPSDRRGWLISLTDRGLEVIDRILPTNLASAERFLVGLDASERKTLAALLRKLLLSEPFASVDPARRQ